MPSAVSQISKLNFDGIEIPTAVSQISKVERLNSLAIND